MEKLQKALNDARRAREQALAGSPVAPKQTGMGLPNLTNAPQERTVQPAAPKSAVPQPEAERRVARPGVQGRVAENWADLLPYEPNPDHLQKQRILTLNSEQTSNPFDVLRTKILLLMKQHGWKRLAITSPNRACGKTTTACNLAVGLSRQRERRTILFDMDLRRPNVANMMGRRPRYNIKSMFTGDVDPKDQLLCLRGNVGFALNAVPVPDSTQLMLAQRTSDTLDRIQTDFDPDMMIFDLPPMFAADDTRAFLKNVDCAMIVARAENTKTSHLDQCEREVAEQTNVLGVVLNNCRHVTAADQYSDEDY